MHRLALSVLAMAAAAVFAAAPISFDRIAPTVSTASAATEVDINLFFTSLSPYGAWVPSPDYNYVWVPTQVDADWSPYTNGHWVYTDRYGWYFVSDEPFAWIVYHYGRWAYDPLVGWYWVPGTQFAGAWVAWRKSDTTLGWAPLPPQGRGYQTSLSVSISITNVPQHYWVFVPAQQFLAPTLKTVVFFGDRRPEFFTSTQPAGIVVVQNNIVVNNVININFIQQQTKQQVMVTKVEATSDPKAAQGTQASSPTSITAFVTPIKPADKTVMPSNVVERTAVQTPTKGQAQASASGPSLASGPATPAANPKCSDAAFAKANPKDCATGANAAANATTTGTATATTGTPPAGQTPNATGTTAATGNAAVNAKCSDATFAKANPKDCASANAAANAITGTTVSPNAAGANTATTGNAAATGNAGKATTQGNANVNAGNPRCADAAFAKANPKTCNTAATVTPNATAGAAATTSGPAANTTGNASGTANVQGSVTPKANANTAVQGNTDANATAATGNARCSDAAFAKANAKLCGTQGGGANPNANTGGNAAANAGASANGPANGKGSVSVQGNAALDARCSDATFAKSNPNLCKVQGKAGGNADAAATAPAAPAPSGY